MANNNGGRSRKARGQKGGETTLKRHGKGFFSEIGSEGGQAAQESGNAHELSREERARGGRE
jgi:hypothetical protein